MYTQNHISIKKTFACRSWDEDDLGNHSEEWGTMVIDLNTEKTKNTMIQEPHWMDTYFVI
jgi:hypothetical protein